jgi:hypothetical protein
MTKAKLALYIVLEFVFGLGFGITGGLLFSMFDTWDIFNSVLFTFIVIFVTIPVGVGMIGYFYLKQLGCQKDFGKSILLSILGLVGFVMLYLILDSFAFKSMSHYVSSILLPIILPSMGAVLGFNYKVITRKGFSNN